MEAAICTLVSQFKTFAGKDGSSSTLSKEEFHKLVASQLPNFVKVDVKDQSQPMAETGVSHGFFDFFCSCRLFTSASVTANERNVLILMTVICLNMTFSLVK